MDPLSVTASTIALLQASSKFSTLFLSKNRAEIPNLEDIIGDLPVYNDILQEMSEMIPSFYGTLPRAANSALILCERRMKKIFTLMSKEDATTWNGRGDKVRLSDLERAADRYRQSVSLLRDVVMDSITHQLLRDQQTDLGRRLAGTAKPTAKQRTQSGEDPTTFDAYIMGANGHVVGRGLLDSGCDDNWITLDVVKRAGLESTVTKEAYSRTFVGFGGHGVRPIGKIKITWFANNAPKTRETVYYVAEDGPFDVLLGSRFIFRESIFTYDAEALVLKLPKLTDEERKQQEENERLAEEREKQDAISRAQQDEEARRRARQFKESVSKSQDTSTNTTLTNSTASSVRSSRSPARQFIR